MNFTGPRRRGHGPWTWLAALPPLSLAIVGALAVHGAPDIDAKIDEPVRRAMESGRPVPVVILGARQFLPPPDGFAEYVAVNASRPRSALRAEVIRGLRAIAEVDQPAILRVLDRPADARRLWIVNAVVGVLTRDEIVRVAGLEGVAFIYHAGEPPPPPPLADGSHAPRGAIRLPRARPPFTLDGKTVDWNLTAIGAARVWTELGVTGAGAIIAVLDQGVHLEHADLRDALWRNEGEVPGNGVDDDDNGFVDDVFGYDFGTGDGDVAPPVGERPHGTFVSGILVGDGSGGRVTGVAPRARLMILRAPGSFYAKARAHEYALLEGADVMNMSFSLPHLGNLRGAWRLMADHAVAAGLVLVSGAGNFRRTALPPEQLRIPEAIPSVIAVGGVTRALVPAPFSSAGPVEWATVKFYEDWPTLTKPDVAAFPGPGYTLLSPAGGYLGREVTFRGNSFSGPHAAGVAALMLSARPELPAWRVKEILEATARDLGPVGKDNDTGAGLIDAWAAVTAAQAAVPR